MPSSKQHAAFSVDKGIQFDAGEDSSLLVIIFSGGGGGLMTNPDNFMSEIGVMNYNRFFLRDPFQLWYQNGITDQISSFYQLCEYLKGKIKGLKAEKILIIGTSSGGHPALLASHYLKADYAHAFGAQTSIGLDYLNEAGNKSFTSRLLKIQSLYRKQWKNRRNFDLLNAMQPYNGKTKYYMHYAEDNQYDLPRARRMEGMAGVTLFGYPYKNHVIAGPLRKDGYLQKIFLSEHLENPQQLFDTYYGREIQETGTSSKSGPSQKTIAEIIQKIAVSKPNIESIYHSKDLLAELALDSVAYLEVVINLENIFGINIDMDGMDVEDLKTVDKILRLINRSKKS